AFRIEERVVDWSGPADTTQLRWVALFSDADHAVEPVTSGARVTLVYALAQIAELRHDRALYQRVDALRAAVRRLRMPAQGPLTIASTAHVIPLDGEQPQPLDTLRGVDRDIADVLVTAGYGVRVRTCVAATDHEYNFSEPDHFIPNPGVSYARLAR